MIDQTVLTKVDIVLPMVYANAQTATNREGQTVKVQTNVTEGTVYVILQGVPQTTVADLNKAVAEGKGAKATVTGAMVDIYISTAGLYVEEDGDAAYFAYAVDRAGRISAKDVDMITILEGVKPLAAFTFDGTLGAVHFVNASKNATQFIWNFGDGKESTDEHPSHVYTATGTYLVTLTAKTTINGVTFTSTYSAQVEIIDLFVVKPNASVEVTVNAYPNPSDGIFNIEYTTTNAIEDVTVRIMDVSGRVVQVEQFNVADKSFVRPYDISMYSKGLYLVQIETKYGVSTKRIVVQK
jgi:PKD repeat protein